MPSMTFLAIVQAAFRDSGIAGSAGPSTVLNQVGRNGDFVRWVKEAYEEIQNDRKDWNFLWHQGTFNLAAADATYAPVADFGITAGVGAWEEHRAYNYVASVGEASRMFMTYIPWSQFMYLPITTPGQPSMWSVDPNGNARYYPTPNQALKVVHEYWENPSEFTTGTGADDAVPVLPARFHRLIVIKAVMLYARFNKDWSLFDQMEREYEDVCSRLRTNQLPDISGPGALA